MHPGAVASGDSRDAGIGTRVFPLESSMALTSLRGRESVDDELAKAPNIGDAGEAITAEAEPIPWSTSMYHLELICRARGSSAVRDDRHITVFNTSLENLKIGSDQSIISGVTHSVFHGFNYSPPEAPYPGWIRYGGYFNENNTWWPHFHLLNEYKGRLSALLQQCDMFADIAILPPTAEMWSRIGMQNQPFPLVLHCRIPLAGMGGAWSKTAADATIYQKRILGDARIEGGIFITARGSTTPSFWFRSKASILRWPASCFSSYGQEGQDLLH
ncbi:MAG: glycosyl hydrolase [Bacteroidales bacterium]|nr:glycosyl hydrolase [Bacteroidales bacterium]